MPFMEDILGMWNDLSGIVSMGKTVTQDKKDKDVEDAGKAGFMKKWTDVSNILPTEATASSVGAPPSAYNAIQSRKKLTQLELLMEPRNEIMRTGFDALRNMYYINSIQKTNKLGSHEIYSKSTAATSGAPSITLGSTKVT